MLTLSNVCTPLKTDTRSILNPCPLINNHLYFAPMKPPAPLDPKTPVIFRVYKKPAAPGIPCEVVALFPETPDNRSGSDLVVYQHVGQHGGGCRFGMINITRPATEAEAAPLLKELQAIGYNNLHPCRKITRLHDEKRRAEARRIRSSADT